jgi:hypothetical protein
MINKKKTSFTQALNDKAFLKKIEMEYLMKTGEFTASLMEELTAVYFINNLLLISSRN